MILPRRAAAVTVSSGIAVLMVFAFLPGASGTSTGASPASSSAGTWAYGEVRTIAVHPLLTTDGWQYEGTVTIGYSVVLNQTNGTAGPGTFGLSVARTEGVSIALDFCRPSCAAPLAYANLSMRAWERSDSLANLTTNGTVNESGAPVPAIALIDASSATRANVTETTFSAIRASASSPVVDRSKYLSAAFASDASVAFTPALGLVPLNVLGLNPSSANWTASSAFNATGSVRSTYYYAFHGPIVGNLTEGPTTVVGTFPASGNVSIAGSFASPSGISFGGVGTFPALRLSVNGPFLLQDGIVLVPSSADLFAAASHPWAANQATTATAQLATFDLAPYLDGHLGLVATSRSYALTSANPGEITGPATANATAIAAEVEPLASNPVAAMTLQAQPIPVGTAESNSQCLVTGAGCSISSQLPRALFATALVAGVVVGAVALIVAVVIVDRRRLPPPSYPNSRLYPPGPAGPAVPARAPAAPEPPAEDDPLDHLW